MTRVIYHKIGIGKHASGVDFTAVSTWVAYQEMENPDGFCVGIVRGELSLLGRDPLRDVPFLENFLLIHTSGEIIAWNYGGERATDEKALNIDSTEADWDNEVCHQAIGDFLRLHKVEVSRRDFSEYVDESFPNKIDIIIPSLEIIDANLVAYLADHPEHLQDLHWRKFEELLETLFKDQGFETELGPGGADGGVDLRLIQRSDIGRLLFLVQAKKHAAHLKIRLDPVKALYASVEDERASKGIFVSTAEFLPGTKAYALRNCFRIKLVGPDDLVVWLQKYGRR